MRSLALPLASLLAAATLAGCDTQPLEPESGAAAAEDLVSLTAKKKPTSDKTGSQSKVEVCHRTEGSRGFILISVAESAVESHMAHGDGLIGDPVPGLAGMIFGELCEPVPARRTITVTGEWNGTSYRFYGLFTVAYRGPVDATAVVDGYVGEMRLGLLGYKAGEANSCSTVWLPEPLPPGPHMNTPTITAHWDDVPPGTYCLNVVSTTPAPPWPPPYSWTATITYP
jgi:hypothetical protein